ncbi:MAG: hypothetical protein P9D89_06045, partial [Candidatus Contendobacter sp.]|nr:hypothetical protein [Candidatus Contendobacter sp.]
MAKNSSAVPSGNAAACPEISDFDTVQEIPCTRITAIKPNRLSKRFALDGNTLIKEAGGNLTDGIAERLSVANLTEFAALLATLKPNQALSYGVNGHARAKVVTAEALAAAAAQTTEPVIARTRDHFSWPRGAGVLMLDYDPAPDGPALGMEALRVALAAACPALAAAPAIWRPSASSCIFDAKTGAELRGIAGQRLYVFVQDAQDTPRAGQRLFDRLWLGEFGRFEISKSGVLMARTLIDGAVFQPERLDFCGGAECGKGLAQRLPEPILFNSDAPFLDTRIALPDLTEEESARLDELRAGLAASLAEERMRIREAWIAKRVDARLSALDEPTRVEARPKLERVYREAAEGGRLGLDFQLMVLPKGGKSTKAAKLLTVRELLMSLAARDRFNEATCLDPLEPDYPDGQGRFVGWICTRAREPYLVSQAHGGTRYLLGDAPKAVEPPPLDERYLDSIAECTAELAAVHARIFGTGAAGAGS